MSDGMLRIQKDHLQDPKVAEMIGDSAIERLIPQRFIVVNRLTASALSLDGNHLNNKAELGAKIQPAARPLRNRNSRNSLKDRAMPVRPQVTPASPIANVSVRRTPIVSDRKPLGICVAR